MAAAVVVVAVAVDNNRSLRGRPDRIFVSIDASTGNSVISFHPTDVGSPITGTDDKTGERAMSEAKAIASKYPGSTVHGPHFHEARPTGKGRGRPRRAP
jgi:hypothetical protein